MRKELLNKQSVDYRLAENLAGIRANWSCQNCGKAATNGSLHYKTELNGVFPKPSLWGKSFSWNCLSCSTK